MQCGNVGKYVRKWTNFVKIHTIVPVNRLFFFCPETVTMWTTPISATESDIKPFAVMLAVFCLNSCQQANEIV